MKILLILITTLCAITLNAQQINGTFFEGPDSLSFNDNHVKFSIRGNDALGVVFTGEGNYEIIEDFLVINTDAYSGKKTKIETSPAEKKDTTQLQLFNEDGFAIQGVRAELLNRRNKSIDLKISDDHGIVLFKSNPKTTAIKVSDLLYDKATFDYKPDSDYIIHLVQNRVLEDKTVILKLIESTDSELTVKLLSTDFNRKNPSDSQLRRLDKKTRAIIDRARSFVKPEEF